MIGLAKKNYSIINHYILSIIVIIRGDLEKVKKHLKKNDVNSVDGQGR